MLQIMAETGAAVLSLDQCMDLDRAREVVPRAALGGVVDPVEALLLGTPEEVATDTRRSLQKGGLERFVLMTGCGTPPGAPIENVKAMVDTAKGKAL